MLLAAILAGGMQNMHIAHIVDPSDFKLRRMLLINCTTMHALLAVILLLLASAGIVTVLRCLLQVGYVMVASRHCTYLYYSSLGATPLVPLHVSRVSKLKPAKSHHAWSWETLRGLGQALH
jgi:hypothetical protein